MSNSVNVDFVTKVVEIEVNDNETESLAAMAAINAARRAEEVKNIVVDQVDQTIAEIEAKGEEEKNELDSYTDTKKGEIAESAAIELQSYVDAAASSAQDASDTATALTAFLETKETLTAPAVDASLSITGAAADSKETGRIVRDLGEHNIFDIFQNLKTAQSTSYKGITYTWNGDGSCAVVGTATAISFSELFSSNSSFPIGMKPGETYYIKIASQNVSLRIYVYINGSLQMVTDTKANKYIVIPSNSTGILIRLNVASGTTVNETVAPKCCSIECESLLGALCNLGTYYGVAGQLGYTDANNIDKNCIIMCVSDVGHTVANIPYTIGWLQTVIVGDSYADNRFQIMYPYGEGKLTKIMFRVKRNDGWTAWKRIDNDAIKNLGNPAVASCDDITDNSIYYVTGSAGSYTIPDAPNKPGWIQTIFNSSSNGVFQISYPWTAGGKIQYRMKNSAGWTGWKTVGSGGGGGGNIYNITANPTITTDTNNYLASTGTTEDVKASIQTMLSQTGVCHLGAGDFYVSGIDIPEGCLLDGCGNATKIYLLDSVTDGYAVKLSTNSTLKDVMLLGATSDITLSSTVGTRHGILWEGNADDGGNANPSRGTVSNVFIKRFNGGGITCDNTGYSSPNGINAENIHITNCNAGLNIAYWSEFNRFTNVNAGGNYYGCINNGGNNMFVNCNFSSNKMGMLMDNSQGQSPNNSHGSAIGCVFNHTNGNTGIGIKILNCGSGFMFDGCQIFYSQTYIEDTNGIVFCACNYGADNCDITIKNGGAVLFNGNMHQAAPTISITNNAHVHFANCYVRSTGAAVTA